MYGLPDVRVTLSLLYALYVTLLLSLLSNFMVLSIVYVPSLKYTVTLPLSFFAFSFAAFMVANGFVIVPSAESLPLNDTYILFSPAAAADVLAAGL